MRGVMMMLGGLWREVLDGVRCGCGKLWSEI